MKSPNESPAAREANMIRARREVAGPALRAALEPVRVALAAGMPAVLTTAEADTILAACRRADGTEATHAKS